MKSCFSAALLCLSTGLVAAQSSTGQVTLNGAGLVSCGNYIAAFSNESRGIIHLSWAQGFLSGMNMGYGLSSGKEFIPLPDSDSIKLYLDKYCRDNPLKRPIDGAIELYRELRK